MTPCPRQHCAGSLTYDSDRRQHICHLCGRPPGQAEHAIRAPRISPASLALERYLRGEPASWRTS